MKFPRTKILTFINNKGGVGKTTLAFNTAVKIAQKGYKTVLVDLDAQCNLTRYALGDIFFANTLYSDNTMYGMLKKIVEGGGDIDMNIQAEPVGANPNLFLFRGDIKLYKYENILPNAFSMAGSGNELGYFQTSALQKFLKLKGLKEEIDVFIIDTSPTLNSLNRAIFLLTDYFIVPVMPDAFSVQGIENLGTVFFRLEKRVETNSTSNSTKIKYKSK
jgi:cellulose biosynthesis protein BcsQ